MLFPLNLYSHSETQGKGVAGMELFCLLKAVSSKCFKGETGNWVQQNHIFSRQKKMFVEFVECTRYVDGGVAGVRRLKTPCRKEWVVVADWL